MAKTYKKKICEKAIATANIRHDFGPAAIAANISYHVCELMIKDSLKQISMDHIALVVTALSKEQRDALRILLDNLATLGL